MIDEFELVDHQVDGYMAIVNGGEITSIVECGVKRYSMVTGSGNDYVDVVMETVEYDDLDPRLLDVEDQLAEYRVKEICINGDEVNWEEIDDPFIFDEISNLSSEAWYSTDPSDYSVFIEPIIGMPEHGTNNKVVLASDVGGEYPLHHYCIRRVYKNES